MNKVIRIAIPKPCGEEWSNMQPAKDGKFCSHCSKTVVDFSQMSDDELLNYFSAAPAVPCGRFHQFQLNRPIVATAPVKLVPAYFQKIAALLVMFAGVNVSASPVTVFKQNISLIQQNKQVLSDTLPLQEFTISGVVKGLDGKPLNNVKIKTDAGEYYSGENGLFSFLLKNENLIPQSLIFSYDSLATVVRSYHPSMQSTSYDIVMHKPDTVRGCNVLMGEPVLGNASFEIDFPSLSFKNKSAVLIPEAKELLSSAAAKLKVVPGATVNLVAYPEKTKHQQELADKRLEAIINYLVEKLGISSDRIKTGKVIGGGDGNVIDLRSH